MRPLALELVGPELGEAGLGLLDEFAEQALIDELLDETLGATAETGHLLELAEGVGFRAAVREAIWALRLAGLDARRLAPVGFADPRKRDLLVALLSRFEERLAREHGVDTADVLRRAAEQVRRGAALPADLVLLVPGLGTRGLTGRFLAALEARGARRLPTDPVSGQDAPQGMLWETAATPSPGPTAELFRAAGITEELREVLRRALALGLTWDQVEIVTPDPGVYGPALHALAQRLAIPVTFAVGLPVERTRAGRVVAAYLRWLQDGFPDRVLRRLLEAGDLTAPHPYRDVDGPRLARALRRLRVGWGRERYLPAVETAIARRREEGPRPRTDEDLEEATARHARSVRELEALHALLAPILESAPPSPGRRDPHSMRVAPATIATGLARFLRMVPSGGAVDETALERLGRILDRLEATLRRETYFPAAVTVLSEHLAIRIPAPRAEGRAPWGSAAGHLHLSDVEHGGWTGRPAVFVVGLDSGRFPGQGTQDPVLLDRERAELAPRDLPGSAARLEERRFRMGALLARLRGRVTLSYAAWEPSEGRVLAPSPLLLDVFRSGPGTQTAGYRDLERQLGVPVSRIPPGKVRLDLEDVWLGALARGGRLLSGDAAVRAAFPALDRGLTARAARAEGPSPHRGLVRARPELDARDREDAPLSASRLEALGACGLRYFYSSVLRIRPPDDPGFDPERWLNPLRRGSLLHGVYERILDETRERGIDPAQPEFEETAHRILSEEAAEMRRQVPSPSEAVWAREMDDLEVDLRSFVGMIRDDHPEVVETELAFGLPGSPHPAVAIPLGGTRQLWLRGAVDRVDRLPSDRLRVVDYKTGSPRPYGAATTYKGGRRLQHVLYSRAVRALLGSDVERAEYHFPTRRGENLTAAYHSDRLVDGLSLVNLLLDLAAAGRFLPTENVDDCFICDFKEICRAQRDQRGRLESPPVEWAKKSWEDEAYDLLRAVRTWS